MCDNGKYGELEDDGIKEEEVICSGEVEKEGGGRHKS